MNKISLPNLPNPSFQRDILFSNERRKKMKQNHQKQLQEIPDGLKYEILILYKLGVESSELEYLLSRR
jgi:hypothetical protein